MTESPETYALYVRAESEAWRLGLAHIARLLGERLCSPDAIPPPIVIEKIKEAFKDAPDILARLRSVAIGSDRHWSFDHHDGTYVGVEANGYIHT